MLAPLDPANLPAARMAYREAVTALRALPADSRDGWLALDRVAQARRWLTAFGPQQCPFCGGPTHEDDDDWCPDYYAYQRSIDPDYYVGDEA